MSPSPVPRPRPMRLAGLALTLVTAAALAPGTAARTGDTYPSKERDTHLRYMSPFPPPAPASPPERRLMLATTTSVDATGLLDVLADAFLADTGIALRWIAVGTGAALRQARDGNADAVIVHARRLEDEFLRDGYGVNRRVVARNFFVVVGPAEDPAGVAGAASAAEALARVKAAGAPFVSRGDRSGTHARELDLWAQAGGPPSRAYLETGQGMAETLRVAAERRAYTLTDTATFHGLKGLDGLAPLFGGSPDLENVYAVIAVDPARVPTARYAEAMAFIAFLTSPRGQRLVGELKDRTGRPLFEPLAASAGVDLVK